MIVQDLHLLEVTRQVHRKKISSENDFYWARQLKMVGTGEDQVASPHIPTIGLAFYGCIYRNYLE